MKTSLCFEVDFGKSTFLSSFKPFFQNHFKFLTAIILLLSIEPIYCQNNVISQLWQESNGVYSGKFGVPTVVDNSDNFYRAGFEKHSQGGTDVKLQKIDEEGTLLWTATVAISGGGAGSDIYEPTKITTDGSNIYITGIVTYSSSSESDFFVSEVNSSGAVQWFTVDSAIGNDVTSDILYDGNTSRLYITGTTEREGDYDMLLAAYNLSGGEEWLVAKDYNGNADLGAVLKEDGGNFIVNGSSQQNSVQWDIATWVYDDGGSFVSHSRNTGLTASSHQFEDATIANGHINITGSAVASSLQEFKVVCLDANTNYLWQNTYSKNSLPASGTAIIPSSNSFVAVGYVTHSAGNENILVRKYNLTGSLLWSKEFDKAGGNDRAVAIVEDGDGNYLVLADVSDGGQKDVYIYYLDGSDGSLEWSERVSDDMGLDETAISLEGTLGGEVYVTYMINNLAVTEAYGYGEVDFPLDNEPFSRGSFYITNSGQLKDENDQSLMDMRFFSFGLSPSMYFSDEALTALIVDSDTNLLQRIDFDFLNNNSVHVGYVEEFEKETYFNYYGAHDTKYEMQGTFDVIAYPNIYEDIDAFISTNSEGFKMTFVLGESSNIANIELDINGMSGLSLNSGDLHVQTINDDLIWIDPYSYETSDPEKSDDGCIEYSISNGNLRFTNTCGYEFSYPYIIQIKVGVGAGYSSSSIDNIDWSTFFGGDKSDVANDVIVDNQKNIFVGGHFESKVVPSNIGQLASFTPNFSRLGVIAKFNNSTLKLEWVTVLGMASTTITAMASYNFYDPPPPVAVGDEIIFAGEVTTDLNRSGANPNIKLNYRGNFVQSSSNPSDLIFGVILNNGGLSVYTPFGGEGIEHVYEMDIVHRQFNPSYYAKLYIVGSTDHGSIAKGSYQGYPGEKGSQYASYFPVYDPQNSSFFDYNHSSPGNQRGFITAFNLSGGNAFGLEYSSLFNNFEAILDIELEADQYYSYICGKGIGKATIGRFEPNWVQSPTYWDYTHLDYFSSLAFISNSNINFFGLNETKINSLQTSGTSPQYQNSNGQSYMAEIGFSGSTATINWDTYFGYVAANANQTGEWSINLARGKLAQDDVYQTTFATGVFSGNEIETQAKTGFFSQSAIANSPSTAKSEGYLAAFSDEHPSDEDIYSWGTIFGGEGDDLVTDLVAYSIGNKSYVITVGSSTSKLASTTSDIDKFPLADKNPNVSYFQSANGGGSSTSFSDFIITRFDVTDVNNNISNPSHQVRAEYLNVYPNPTSAILTIELSIEAARIESLKIFDCTGSCVIARNPMPDEVVDGIFKISLNGLAKGVYTVNVNEHYNAKVIKL